MAFSIRFTRDPDEFLGEDETPSAVGEIEIGDFRESFIATLFEWSRMDYEKSWRAELERLLHGADRAVLLTQLLIPDVSGLPNWWALYRGEGGVVYLQEHLGIRPERYKEFSPDQPSQAMSDRETHTPDGIPFSEWSTTIDEIEAFVNSLSLPF